MTNPEQADPGPEIERLRAIVAEFRHRLETTPDALFPAHAESLLRLGSLLAGRGETEAARDTVAEAVMLLRAMAQIDPAAFGASLAAALNTLSIHLSDTKDDEGARIAGDQAVAEGRAAMAAHPEQARFVLVSALIGRAGRHLQDADIDATLNDLTEAVEVYHGGGTEAVSFLGPMIEALHRAALAFSEIGRWAEAIDARRLMVSLFDDPPPPAMVHLLALTLQQTAQAMGRDHRLDVAENCAEEAVSLARMLDAADSPTYRLFLAQALGSLAGRRHNSGNDAAALEVALEAVNTFHEVIEKDPLATVPSLVLTLQSLTAILTALDMPDQAASIDMQRVHMQATLELMLRGDIPAN